MNKQGAYHYGLPTINYGLYPFENKETANKYYINYMLSRLQSMFEYDGLPDSIPQRFLELYLQTNGNVCITKVDGELRAFAGALGGEPDIYYFPTKCVVANPRLEESLYLDIGTECVIIPNDSMYTGLLPLINRFTSALVENDISMLLADVNNRMVSLITASDDSTKKSAEAFLQNIKDGKQGVIASNAFFDGLKSVPYATTSSCHLTDLIEYEQYLKASLFNELGLQSNYNMKREAINSNESQLNEDALLPLVDDMLNCRRKGVESVNKLYGTNITVKLSSAWEDVQESREESMLEVREEYVEETDQIEERVE